MKHNNQIPDVHFHKDWDKWVKTWFDQPGRKKRRRVARLRKAQKVAPAPVDGLLRPVVRPPTPRYNMRQRLGRGFTVDELKAAGIPRQKALTIGISVDHRRKNDSVESLQENVKRLNEYMSRLIVFPRKPKHPVKGESTKEEFSKVKQVKGVVLPIQKPSIRHKARVITEEERKKSVFTTTRRLRADKRLVGIRKKRAEAKKEAEKLKLR